MLSIVVLGALVVISLYAMFISEINKSLATIEGAWIVLIIILIRIVITSGMASFMFYKWFKQEEQYLSDIPFLFGLFFLILVFGKFLDLLVDLTHYTLDPETYLLLFKIRYIIAILTLAPMYFLSINMILIYFSLKDRFKKYGDEKKRKRTALIILILIVSIELLIILIVVNPYTARIILPAIVIPSLITIIWIFFFAYRNKRLSQIHPLIVAIGFTLYLISQFTRVILHFIFGETALSIVIAEITDIVIFVVIFIGLSIKVKYSTE